MDFAKKAFCFYISRKWHEASRMMANLHFICCFLSQERDTFSNRILKRRIRCSWRKCSYKLAKWLNRCTKQERRSFFFEKEKLRIRMLFHQLTMKWQVMTIIFRNKCYSQLCFLFSNEGSSSLFCMRVIQLKQFTGEMSWSVIYVKQKLTYSRHYFTPNSVLIYQN